jgi:uncharacterized RDD family membrane protein YckC
MPWFYANAGKQLGPIDDAEFERLVREGVIQSTTLVWREGMQQWQPFTNVTAARTPPDLTAVAASSTNQVTCSECGKLVNATDTVQIGAAIVCAACKPTYVQKLREGAVLFTPAVGPVRYAGFWIRLAAYVIDQVIQSVVSLPLSIWLSVRMQTAMQFGKIDWSALVRDYAVITAWSFLLATLYGWLFVGRYGATPGKMLVRIKVVRADGTRIGYALSLGRQFAELVSTIPCMLGYLFVAFDEQKRGLHDFICNTRVIYK